MLINGSKNLGWRKVRGKTWGSIQIQPRVIF